MEENKSPNETTQVEKTEVNKYKIPEHIEQVDISKSPMLSQIVIDRVPAEDLTKTNEPSKTEPVKTEGDTKKTVEQKQPEVKQPEAPKPPPLPEPDKMKFEGKDSSDSGDFGGEPGKNTINVSNFSADNLSEIIIEAVRVYLPKLSGTYCKVDIKNIVYHVMQGNLAPNMVDAFRKINDNTDKELKIDPEELKFLKFALQEYLKTVKIEAATPLNTLIGACAIFLISYFIKIRGVKKDNEALLEKALEESKKFMSDKKAA